MTGGRRYARNRRDRAELLGVARSYAALLERAGTDEEIDVERNALARRVRGIEGRS